MGLRIFVCKEERDNIDNDGLEAFKNLAKGYAALTDHQIVQLLNDGDFVEICHGEKDQVQK